MKKMTCFVLFTGTSVFVYIFEVTDWGLGGGQGGTALQSLWGSGMGEGGRLLQALDIYKCCESSEIWQPYFTMCEAPRTWMHTRTHNSGIISLHLCARVNMRRGFVCVCACVCVCVCVFGIGLGLAGSVLHGWVHAHLYTPA